MNTPTTHPGTDARLTPTEAWERLRAGNRRFVEGKPEHPNQDPRHRASLAAGQQPFAVIFGCSDSRVPPELVFDTGLGDLFMVRTAGQVIDEAALGSLEYSVDALDVPLLVVLGHEGCGAVTAALESYTTGQVPAGFVRSLVERILPSVLSAQRAGVTDVDGTVDEHVVQSCQRVVESSPTVAAAVQKGRTAVLGLTYSLAEGTVRTVHGPDDLDRGGDRGEDGDLNGYDGAGHA